MRLEFAQSSPRRISWNQFRDIGVAGAGQQRGETAMRMLFGIILGAALTVSIAFIADTWKTGPTTGSASTAVEHRQMVNWDVVGDNMRIARERMREAWIRISQKVAG
jgi:hypothetical protein